MQLLETFHIGRKKYTIIHEGKDLYECIEKKQKLSFPRKIIKCPLCGSDNLDFYFYEAGQQKYKYLKIICRGCKGSVQFSNRRDDPETIYLKKNNQKKEDWQPNPKNEQYKSTGRGSNPSQQTTKQPQPQQTKTSPSNQAPPTQDNTPPPPKEDDLPF